MAPILAVLSSVNGQDPPQICVPPFDNDAANLYTYLDYSEQAKANGHGVAACTTFIQSTQCSATGYDLSEATYLQLGVAEQIAKDGTFESTTNGPWIFTFVSATSAFPNRDVSEEFNGAVTQFYNAGYTFIPSNIYFQVQDVDGGQQYAIQGTRTC